jgi:GT2 family glycosyltransferase
MALSIIIVNFKSADLVLDCLTELYRDPGAAGFEVIVADNDSGDDSHPRITNAFPQIRWLQINYNSGFARANNAAIRQASGDAILLLNGDTLPYKGVVSECYLRFMASAYVACGVQLLNTDGTPQISGNFVMTGGLNYLLPVPYLGSLVKKAGEWMKVEKPHVHDTGYFTEVDWINGAYLMVKRHAIARAGMLDEDFFLYSEESEWCGRLRKQGKICLYGDLNVVHLQGVTANVFFGSEGQGYVNLFDRKGRQLMVSNFVRIRKQFGVGWFLVQMLGYIAGIPVFFTGQVFARLSGRRRYQWRQFFQYCRNVGVVIGKSPRIIGNKPYFYKVI